MALAHRKTVPVDQLRELLGDAQTDALLEKMSPPKPTVQVGLAELSLANKLYADPLIESKNWSDTVDVVRRYFLERGQARRYFLSWVQQTLDGSPEDATTIPAPVRRTRRKVTDPAVLDKRRKALAKAREVRAQKLAAQRAGR
ncbi:MAG: hypothetical protein ACREQM_01980 [Candidatus Dormibacteraceae bacterium]